MSIKKLFTLDPFDRYILSVIGILVVLIVGIVLYGDHVGVHVVEVEPSEVETGVNTEILISFDQPMDTESVRGNFVIEPVVDGTFRWRNTTLIFSPREPLIAGKSYRFGVKAGAKSFTGRELKETLMWRFSTRETIAMVYYLSPANVANRTLWGVLPSENEPFVVFSPAYGVFDFEPSPTGGQIAVTVYGESNMTTDLWLINPDGSQPELLLDCSPGACGRPVWSPDGRLMAYERQTPTDTGALAPSRIWLLDMDTRETAPIFADSQILGYQATWGMTGRILSFYDSNTTSIRVINLDTQESQQVETQLSERWSFSPDNQWLAYTDLRLDDNFYYAQLWQVELWNPDAKRELIVAEPQEDQEPVWSPDGEWVAFRRREIEGSVGNGWQVMLYHPASQAIKTITNDEAYTSRNLRWSADSQSLIFQRYNLLPPADNEPVRPIAEVWFYDLQTDEVRLLANDGFNPRWVTE